MTQEVKMDELILSELIDLKKLVKEKLCNILKDQFVNIEQVELYSNLEMKLTEMIRNRK